jgi:TolB-like protein/tRNA A-37 threonylcarbamoyl transferase component Bud32
MIGQRLAHFRIVEKIGAGGMGEVYKAHDEQLDRDVAIKVLPAGSFRDPAARARLLREARTASKLNHPHICTIHEVGEADGQAYIAMELVEGQPLSARLAGGALPPEQVLRYGLQLADALAHAHQRGIIHRDLKSANVIITPEGRAKVLDFGLAKRLSGEELTEATTQTMDSLTGPGTVVGTLAYMAPEQLRGRPADARSDLWALGVMFYEMAAGERPFQGRTGFELSSAILSQPPPPLPPRPQGAPPAELEAVIERCLEKDPAQRYQRSEEVRAALEAVQSGRAIAPVAPRPFSRRWLLTLGGAAWAIILAVAFALNVGGLRERLLVRTGPLRIQSLALLPLENLSGDPGQEYFADGMTEALITDLARLRGLKRVIARGSVMRYKGTRKPLSEIARELKVDALVTGAVLRGGDRVRITAQLINPATEEQLWADGYERSLRDVLALQSEVARAIADKIRVKLTPQEQSLAASARQVNPEAYQAYLKGRFHWYNPAPQDLETALQYFQLALERDPNLALAYTGIAQTWLARGHLGYIPPREALPKAKAAALKAVQLDDTLVEAHHTLAALAFYFEWNWPAAEEQFQRGIDLNPNYPDLRVVHAAFLAAMGRWQGAREGFEQSLESDPHNSYFRYFFGAQLIRLRRYDEAIAELQKVVTTDPNFRFARSVLSNAFHEKRMYKEALAEASNYFAAVGDNQVVEALARGYAEGGYAAAMRRAAEMLATPSSRTYVLPTTIAAYYARAGQKDRALDWLERAYQERDTILVYLNVTPIWDSLRSDPRFQDLLRRMKFPVK